ncbi:DUF6370 family protein [Flavobacterium longum]|uniref:DUF6370 family protein n=1 Tax=Flavobacterium longum TaxID=1299340 RepID=UPI0039EA9A8A
MKKIILFLALVFSASMAAQDMTRPEPPRAKVVDVACGQCQFKMDGKGCTLAVMLDGKPYFVEGVTLDQQGDAHAHDGMCNAVRQAEVQGELVGDKFKATSFKLLPATDKGKKKK